MERSELRISTERLILRPFESKDMAALADYCGLPDVQRYMDWHAHDPADRKAALESMRHQTRLTRPGDMVTLAIVRRSDSVLLGQVSLQWTDATAAQGEMRVILNPTFRRQGFAREAAHALLALGFGRFHLHRIFARTAGDNLASARLFEGLGMRLEAHYREHAYYQGRMGRGVALRHPRPRMEARQRRQGNHPLQGRLAA